MWTVNAMSLLAQRQKAQKKEIERKKNEELSTSFSSTLQSIIAEMPPIFRWQKKPTLAEFLSHIQKPKGYIIDPQRWAYLDAVLLSTDFMIWHHNGIPVKSVNEVNGAKVSNDIVKVVRFLSSQLVQENNSI